MYILDKITYEDYPEVYIACTITLRHGNYKTDGCNQQYSVHH